MTQPKAYRAAILHSLGDPAQVGLEASHAYYPDGVLVVADGRVRDIGPADEVLARQPAGLDITRFENRLITSGFIDTHIHFPQTEMIASYGEQLLDWLNNYTFPEERKFVDQAHGARVAELFLDELLRNGTTTAMVFGTVHKASVDAFFTASHARNMRMIAGKVMMDRHAPDYLLDTPESGYADSKELIERWHKKGRQLYAVTPRFAPTSTAEQLALAGKLLAEYDDVYMQTHLSENQQEIEWVKSLFPEQKGYLDVYDHFGLLGDRSVFAHAVHLEQEEAARMGETDSVISFCPTSNLFLGSGLFDLPGAEQRGIRVGLGTDVGAGTSFSMLQTINEAYKIQQLRRHKLHPLKALYLATLGGARSLRLEDKVGNLAVGKEADFLVLDLHATPLMQARMNNAHNLFEQLFVLMMLGDDRAIAQTYIYGECRYRRDH
ncbi:guanine deaminase [Zobellella denitrificans]|jgi:guanine deaminase|uniref:Guanine deaminase n=1 Tax=Zobellella denitrificans TaxID=347534 RepID=A0A231MYR7_9GAMM|nr:guanine deaminase [Zobellella denitrificans]ATG72725.1 guanine deaminase [Zobellella denitrificans]OXS15381.1 guanine deaminase [Zobellella denitrificans]